MRPTCLLLSTGDYLVYDTDKATLLSMYRTTANFWVDRKEDRALTDEEIEALENWEIEEVEEREPSEEEYDILGIIKNHHPETKYIVESIHKVYGKEERKTGLEDVKESSGLKKMVFDFFESFIRDPDKAKEGKRLKEKLMKEWKGVKELEKRVQEDKPLRDFLMVSLDEGVIGPDQLTVLDELIRRDPSWLKEIDIPDVDDDDDKVSTDKLKKKLKEDPILSLKISAFSKILDDEDVAMEKKDLEKLLGELLRGELPHLEIDIEIEGDPADGFNRKVRLLGELGDIIRIANKYKIKTTDLLEDFF